MLLWIAGAVGPRPLTAPALDLWISPLSARTAAAAGGQKDESFCTYVLQPESKRAPDFGLPGGPADPALAPELAGGGREQRAQRDARPEVGYMIRGERHSGTGWVRYLLKQNTVGVTDWQDVYGHKHNCLPDDVLGALQRHPRHGLVVVWRNAFAWLVKMHEVPYARYMESKSRRIADLYLPNPGRPPFSAFIRQLAFLGDHSLDDDLDTGHALRRHYVKINGGFVRIRNLKYRNWLDVLDTMAPRGQATAVQYERLAERPEAVFQAAMDAISMPRRPEFINTERKVQHEQVLHEAAPAPANVADYMSLYTAEDIRFMLTLLNPEIEAAVGYDYAAERAWAVDRFGEEAIGPWVMTGRPV